MTCAAELHTLCTVCGQKATYVISAASVVLSRLKQGMVCLNCDGPVRLAGYSGRRPSRRGAQRAANNNGGAR